MLGEELKRRREELGLTLTEIADSTRIGTRFLKAIEADDYAVLPEGIYARSFVKAFARQVHMDENEAVGLYQAQTGAEVAVADPVVPPLEDAEPFVFKEASSGFWPAAIVALVLGVVFIGGAYAVWQYTQAPSVPPPPSSSAAIVSDPAVPSVTVTAPAAATEAATDSAAGLQVTLQALDRCWVRYTADDGQPVQREMQQGESEQIRANQSIDLSIGNTHAISLQINGREARFPDNTGIVLRKLTITPESAKDLLIN